MIDSLFAVAVAKRLSLVEVSPAKSNQHELNGVNKLLPVLGDAVKGSTNKEKYNATFVYLSDQDFEPIDELVELTWYDSRARSAARTGRSELRLYFKDNAIMRQAEAGDILIVAKHTSGELFFFVVAQDAPIATVVEAFFGVKSAFTQVNPEILPLLQQLLGVLTKLFGLEVLDAEFQKIHSIYLETRFGNKFPSTKDFSQFARETCPQLYQTVDDQLMAFMQHEERLFRILENK
jgi:hypothetical protein